ncbi:MAG: Uncharacterized protein Greene041679_526 [Parcubacteria group bacterium Greene0416_79]|nr:MAG: Uncharacterized protein Greene041679_526 [Parcubacteria group bacterium Greene0416_79]
MRFQVPQFINIEDKLFGPLTVKQFVYLVGGGGMVYILYQYLPFYVALFIIAPVAALALALAFLKINNKPFIFTLQAAIIYAFGVRLYLWRKQPKKITPAEALQKKPDAGVPALSESRLKDLSWALDINQSIKK